MVDIELFSAVIVRPAINELIAEFETLSGFKVAVRYDLNPLVKKRIDEGENFDVVIINPNMLSELAEDDRVSEELQNYLGRVEMGLAIKTGAAAIDCSTSEKFKAALLAAKSVGYSVEGTSGKTFAAVLSKLGILDEMKATLRPVGGGQTSLHVASGDVEIGALPHTVIMESPGIELGGLFPQALQTRIDLAAGKSNIPGNPQACDSFLKYLGQSSATQVLAAHGVLRTF